MPAPLHYHLLPAPNSYRRIENEYHLEMTAKNTEELVQLLEFQRESSAESLSQLTSAQQEATDLLAEIALNSAVANEKLEELADLASDTLVSIRQGFAIVATQMLEQQRLLRELLTTLRNPYDTQVKELLLEADRALTAGMRSTAKERAAEFSDALRLISAVLENLIGSRDCSAWFQYGYLMWQYKGKLNDAEDAFYHAARLAKDKAPLYHVKGLRHQAHMQYLQSKYPEAFKTVSAALPLASDYELFLETGRYAARAGRQEALQYVERCLDMRPANTLEAIEWDRQQGHDFDAFTEEIRRLVARKESAARRAATASLARWQNAMKLSAEAQRRAAFTIVLPEWAAEAAAERVSRRVGSANYVVALAIDAKARAATAEVSRTIVHSLESEAARLNGLLKNAQNRAAGSKERYDRLVRDGPARLRTEQSSAKERLRSLARPNFLGNMIIGAGYSLGALVVGAILALVFHGIGMPDALLNLLLLPLFIVAFLGWLLLPCYHMMKRAPERARIQGDLASAEAQVQHEIEQAAEAVRSAKEALRSAEQEAQESLPRILPTIDWLKQQPDP